MNNVIAGDAAEVLRQLPSASFDMCITSPPYYGLRDYETENQIGLEESPEEYIERLVCVFREVRRVLKNDGTLWLNIGDSYATKSGAKPPRNTRNRCGHTKKAVPAGYKAKDLIGIPWMLAFALRSDGWYLRQDIIWAKGNPMPESVKDRCTKSHEHVFLFSKQPRYFFNQAAIKEPCSAANVQDFLRRRKKTENMSVGGYREARPDLNRRRDAYMPTNFMRNRRDVWIINTKSFKGAHFATFPEALAEPCIRAGCRDGGTVLDPFFGSGTVGVVALKEGKNYIGIEINEEYAKLAEKRIEKSKEEQHGNQEKNDNSNHRQREDR